MFAPCIAATWASVRQRTHRNEGGKSVYKTEKPLCRQPDGILCDEHSGDLGGHWLADERRHYDADLWRYPLADMGARNLKKKSMDIYQKPITSVKTTSAK